MTLSSFPPFAHVSCVWFAFVGPVRVGLDWGALGSEEAMRAGLRSHYGI
eukprot:COSAG06_NODE_34437_length_474_cov_1.325333_2_plen_48_part_01